MNIIEKAFLAGRSQQSWYSFRLENITEFTKSEAAKAYSNFIASDPTDDQVKELNQKILTKWSNSGLADIKDEAWKILEQLTKI